MAKSVRPKVAKTARSMPSPAPSAASRPTPPASVMLFDVGMRALQRHEYKAAAEKFRAILADDSGDRAVNDRARVYLELCGRELTRRPSEPTSVEDRLTEATAALNAGDDARAEKLARLVTSQDSRQDLAHYLLAAVEARRGNTQRALALLGQAIALRPDVAAQALHDEDFVRLRTTDQFLRLTEPVKDHSARRDGRGGIDR